MHFRQLLALPRNHCSTIDRTTLPGHLSFPVLNDSRQSIRSFRYRSKGQTPLDDEEGRIGTIGHKGRQPINYISCTYHAGPSDHPVGGGSIDDTYQVLTKDNRRWFCKFDRATGFTDLLAKEARGLALLGQLGPLRVPAVIACEPAASTSTFSGAMPEKGPLLKIAPFRISSMSGLRRGGQELHPSFPTARNGSGGL